MVEDPSWKPRLTFLHINITDIIYYKMEQGGFLQLSANK